MYYEKNVITGDEDGAMRNNVGTIAIASCLAM